MRRPLALLVPASLFALAASLPFAPGAFADPVVRFTWGPASAIQLRQNFAGPATYAQTLSVTGLSGTVSRLSTRITHGPYDAFDAADAWRPLYPEGGAANAPLDDCLGARFYVVTGTAAGATTIPNATVSAVVYSFDGVTNFKTYSGVEIELTIDPPLVADPGTRYGFATIEYRHQNSATGAPDGSCHHAERGFCFVQANASATVGGFVVPAVLETGILAWQQAADPTTCLDAVTPARGSTWGAVKTLYR